MRSHEACCFSMMRINVLDALGGHRVALYGLDHELSCSRLLAVGARHRGPSVLNFGLRLRSQEGFEQKSPL